MTHVALWKTPAHLSHYLPFPWVSRNPAVSPPLINTSQALFFLASPGPVFGPDYLRRSRDTRLFYAAAVDIFGGSCHRARCFCSDMRFGACCFCCIRCACVCVFVFLKLLFFLFRLPPGSYVAADARGTRRGRRMRNWETTCENRREIYG